MSKKKDLLEDLLENLPEEDNEVKDDIPFSVDDEPKKETKQEQKQQVGWFKTGNDAVDYAKQRAIAMQQRIERSVPVFRLKVDEEAIVVFVDDKGFGIHQHKVKIGDRWVAFTCIKDFAPCAICATGNKSSYVIFYTAIDTRPFTDKDGKTTKFRKVLFPATGSTLQMRLADEKEEKKTLVGAVLKFKRYSAKESSSGTLIENKGRIDIASKFGKEFAVPLDYMKILAPPTQEELEAFGFNGVISGSDDDILGDLDV